MRGPGRPKIEYTEEQERLLALAQVQYREYRRVQRSAREEAKRIVASHRKQAALTMRALYEGGLSVNRISREVTNSGDTSTASKLIEEGEDHG